MIYHLVLEENIEDEIRFVMQSVPCLIHYIGDNHGFEPGPHGNSKTSSRGFQRTHPSIMQSIKTKCQNQNAHIVYKESKQACKPRDQKQCQNMRYVISILYMNKFKKACF